MEASNDRLAAEGVVAFPATREIPTNTNKMSFRDGLVGVPPQGSSVAFVAFSIMAAFPRRTPHWSELSERFGMDRATAYRYLTSLKAVRGEC